MLKQFYDGCINTFSNNFNVVQSSWCYHQLIVFPHTGTVLVRIKMCYSLLYSGKFFLLSQKTLGFIIFFYFSKKSSCLGLVYIFSPTYVVSISNGNLILRDFAVLFDDVSLYSTSRTPTGFCCCCLSGKREILQAGPLVVFQWWSGVMRSLCLRSCLPRCLWEQKEIKSHGDKDPLLWLVPPVYSGVSQQGCRVSGQWRQRDLLNITTCQS